MIEVKNLSKSFGNFNLLQHIQFSVQEGEKLSILGPGGCGKSTLFKLILGLEPPTSGEISLLGHDMVHAKETEKQQILKKAGVAFQQGALFDYMTVEDNLRFAMYHMTDMNKDEREQKIDHLLAGVKLSRTRKMYPYELSGGMQRRIGIARALATDPTVAFFDEPTSGLDPVTSTIILNMIHELGTLRPENTLIVATSAVEIAIRFADRVIMINEGQIAADGPWRELILNGSEWVKHFLSARLIGIDIEYARELGLPEAFIQKYW